MGVSSLALNRQNIDEEIRKLKTRRNTSAPISHLPTEILSRIFIIIAYSCFDGSRGNDLSWIRSVTAVCSHWRAIALDCPGLWCLIVFRWRRWTEEMLKRSKMAPLVVEADGEHFTSEMMDNVHLALQHISRIRDLHLVAFKDDMENFIDPDKHAPLLKSLCLSDPEIFSFEQYTLPVTLFVGDGHHLERLEVVRGIISWDAPLLCGLGHLKLHNTPNVVEPTLLQVLEALEKMPFLETLDLMCYLPVVLDDDDFRLLESERVVHLSHLTTLRLSSTAVECAYLLNHLTYPASTSLGLSCSLSKEANDLSILFDAISSVWNGKEGSKLLRSLLISTGHFQSTNVQGWTTRGGTDEIIHHEPAQIDVELKWFNIGFQKGENIAIDACRALNLTNLHNLSVNVLHPIPKATWLSAFGNLTSLRTVHVGDQASIGFVSALSTGLEESPSEDSLPNGIFLPNLHNLWFRETHLQIHMPFNGAARITFLGDLKKCLMNRCHWNAEVRKLHLEFPNEFYDQGELLREIVVDVDWLGVDEETDEEGDEETDGELDDESDGELDDESDEGYDGPD